MVGVLDYTPALNNNLNVDDTGNTFVIVLNGRFKVYIDPYVTNQTAKQFYTVGYKGTSPYDEYVLLPICSTTNGESSWREQLPTENWIQN